MRRRRHNARWPSHRRRGAHLVDVLSPITARRGRLATFLAVSDVGHAYAPSASVLSQEIEGETVLLDMEREHFYSLDSIGTRVWKLLAEHGDVEALLASMLLEFDVDEATLRRDIVDLLDRLQEQGLVVSAPAP